MAGTLMFYTMLHRGMLEILPKGSKVTVDMPPVHGMVKIYLVGNPLISDYAMTEEVKLITDADEIRCLLSKL